MTDDRTLSRRGFLGATGALGAAGLGWTTRHDDRPRERWRHDRRTAERLNRSGEFVVRGASVLTMDPAIGDLPNGDVHVRDGAIVAIGPDLQPRGVAELDAGGMIALPGIVDTHWHLWTAIARGLSGAQTERTYVPLIQSLGPAYRPEDIYTAVRLGLAEGLAAGITTVHDWSHNLRGPEWADAGLQAHVDTGVRARFSYGGPQGQARDAPIDVADVERLQQAWIANGRAELVTLGLAVRGPDASAPSAYRPEWEAARALGIPVTMHALPRQPTDAVQILGREGLLGPDVQLVHGIYASQADRDLMASTDTTLSVSPASELLFGWGAPQITEMLDAGVGLSLSIDNTMLVGHADPFTGMRLALSLGAADLGAELALSPRRVLELATIDGARDLGLDDRIGSLTPGKRADLILVRADDVNTAPLVDPVSTVVRSAQPSNVDTVVIDGVVHKSGGHLTTLDSARITADAATSLAAVRERAGDA